MKFLNSLTPKEQAAAFLALANAMPASQEATRWESGRPSAADTYAHLITHGPSLAGGHWWTAIAFADQLTKDVNALGDDDVKLDFDSLVVACCSQEIANLTSQLAGFRQFECAHHGTVWGDRIKKPHYEAVTLSVPPDWAMRCLQCTANSLDEK